jgi:hypothetical protein
VLRWGRRTGKSVLNINWVQKRIIKRYEEYLEKKKVDPELKYTPGRYWIVAPTYKQAKSIYWRALVGIFIPAELTKKRNESELIVEYITGDTIELKGADNEDSLRGAGVDGIVLDEYSFMKPNVWDEILRPMIADSRGWAVFISTPNGFDHFFDLCVYAEEEMKKGNKNWFFSQANSYDNPYLDSKELDEIRKNTAKDVFEQEYLAIPTKKAGLVYKEFDEKTHVTEIESPDMSWVKYVSIDFGQTNPTAVLFIGIDTEDNIYVYDEIYEANLYTSQLAHLIKSKMGTQYITQIFGDQAAAQSIKDLSEHGIYVYPVSKQDGSGEDYFKVGIERIRGYLKIQEGTGKPKLFIAGHCQNLIKEFQNYSWEDPKDDVNAKERPKKLNDHALDALRYFIYEHKKVKVKKKPRPFVPEDSSVGY